MEHHNSKLRRQDMTVAVTAGRLEQVEQKYVLYLTSRYIHRAFCTIDQLTPTNAPKQVCH
jgi:hypothetical protein